MLRIINLVAVFLFFVQLPTFAFFDSTGIEKRGGRVYIIHKVEPKETLFALSRRYNVSVDEIKKENPEVASGLQIGQLVSIPAGTYKETPPPSKAKSKTHEVKPKETLYAISRKYGVSVDDIKKANPGVEVTDLKIGQVINVPAKTASAANKKEDKPEPTKTAAASEPEKDEPSVAIKPAVKEPEKPIEYHVPGWKPGEKISETGVAELIEDNSDTNKYLALHKYAPVGTIVQVTNESNGTTIFVRVIGALPDTGANDKTVLKISKKAFQKLAPTDKRARVKISFIP
ncbi:LysM peptidoglycan-binding domain-containing protein [Cytophagaceae bacterium ABcell3]|nr:LysM peptidoglycan-binding domain-containing protein [Cytophagaceae bacterium ABcell3]